jgi:hypothetical protein
VLLVNGKSLALGGEEVWLMNLPSPLRNTVLGFAFCTAAFAQSPPPAPPADAAPNMPAAPAVSSKLPFVTQSSRIRAFNAGPDGEVRSLYLQNGIVVDLTPPLGGQLGTVVRKGEKITVTGTKSQINGQSLVEAASVQVNDQTFSANAPLATAPGALAQGVVPPPPAPRRKNKVAAPAPCAVPADATPPPPDFGGPPPPPPEGMAPPPPPDGIDPPPPPPQN